MEEIETLRLELEHAKQCLKEERKKQHPTPWNSVDHAETALASQYECKICMSEPVECVFLPCGHCMACTTCGPRQMKCPMCQLPIEETTRIYMG